MTPPPTSTNLKRPRPSDQDCTDSQSILKRAKRQVTFAPESRNRVHSFYKDCPPSPPPKRLYDFYKKAAYKVQTVPQDALGLPKEWEQTVCYATGVRIKHSKETKLLKTMFSPAGGFARSPRSLRYYPSCLACFMNGKGGKGKCHLNFMKNKPAEWIDQSYMHVIYTTRGGRVTTIAPV